MPDIVGLNDKLRNVVDYSGITSAYEKIITEISGDISFYFILIYSLQMLIIILGSSSAAIVALQNNSNERWVKPLAVILTLLLTISASVQNVFHLKENSDALVKLSGKILEETAEIGVEMQTPQTPEQTRENISKRVKTYNMFYTERLRIRGNVEAPKS
ncbi:DUF4231 domain-containing protein [Methylobacterium sp. J-078]|uniref:DUF4231 domain-containing protein n=1 Tax=Methylobacterium sp. J-078 TaxID=2836657 RepID=UPI001FBB9E9B|nr:DUF4231 domain-containing protein [Methylobacterium sp. J-078]MCJ2046112.1 DUF4231 domain-containing protein [Methylobacterium sp. J-078]